MYSTDYNRQSNSETEFYYSGVFPDNTAKAQNMPGNIRRDFEPFKNFLQRSIKSKENATSVGAQFVLPEKEQNLKLCDTLIRIKRAAPLEFSIIVPDLRLYRLRFASGEDDITVSEFKEISIGRDSVIWKKGNFCEWCQENIIIELQDSEEENQKVKVWFDDDSDKNAVLRKIDFSDSSFYDFRNGSDCKISGSRIENGRVYFSYTGKVPEFIFLFNHDFETRKEGSDQPSVPEVQFMVENKNTEIQYLKNDYCLVRNKIIQKKNKGILKINGQKTEYDICQNSEVNEYIHNDHLHAASGGFFCILDEKLTDDDIRYNGIHFKKITNNTENWKLKLKDRQGKNVGTVIELVEDDDFKNDVYSNLDVLFAESTTELSDDSNSKNTDRRKFAIGWTDENNSLMEIAEKDKKGNLLKTDFTSLKPKKLYAVSDVFQLKKQICSINKLLYKPMPDHRPLLELTEKKEFAEWNNIAPVSIEQWYVLKDNSYEGVEQQREFVKRALGTPDFAFLDGPPGSGKTTAILEIISQAVMQGKKLMLAASTNAAVDNILERLPGLPSDVQNKILAVRIGSRERTSENVEKYTVAAVANPDVRNEIITRSNLVCSTIYGILQHPSFNLSDRIQPAVPLYDYLIIDEASKTTFQDFLVPALYAKHWILSGDLNQLTPYTEQEDLEGALKENMAFPQEYQFIWTVLLLLKKQKHIFNTIKLCIPISSKYLQAALKLTASDKFFLENMPVCILAKNHFSDDNSYDNLVTKDDLIKGDKKTVCFFGSKVLFVEDSLYEEIESYLSSDFVPVLSKKNDYYCLAQNAVIDKDVNLSICKETCHSFNDVKNAVEQEVKEHSWAREIIWRLCRLQELFLSKDEEKLKYYEKQVDTLLSEYKKDTVSEEIALIKSIALPSVLQLLQNGVSDDVVKNKKQTALNKGMPENEFDKRHCILEYQHRMHPEISSFSRKHFYRENALKDPEAIKKQRDWNCDIWGESHSVWKNISGHGKCMTKNEAEAQFIKDDINRFMNWSSHNPNTNDKNQNWSIAVLTYYKGQERELKKEIKDLFNNPRERNYYLNPEKHIEVKIFTVDKFQGQEADVVYISMVKSGDVSVGFMDSPNRLNVALTRARFQRIIVGNHYCFSNCKSSLLRDLANEI